MYSEKIPKNRVSPGLENPFFLLLRAPLQLSYGETKNSLLPDLSLKTSFSQKSYTDFLIRASKLRSRFLGRVKTDFAQIRSTRRSIDYLKSGITTPTFWENHFFQKWTLPFSPVSEGHSFWPIWLRSLVQTIYKSIFAWHKGFFNMSTFIFYP